MEQLYQNLREWYQKKGAEPNKRLNVEDRHVQEMWSSKQIAKINVVLVINTYYLTKNVT